MNARGLTFICQENDNSIYLVFLFKLIGLPMNGESMARSFIVRVSLAFTLIFSTFLLLELCQIPQLLHLKTRTNFEGKTLRESIEFLKDEYNFQNVLEEDDKTDDELFGKHWRSKGMCWSAPKRMVTAVSCMSLMEGDEKEIAEAEHLSGYFKVGPTPPHFGNRQDNSVLDCRAFKNNMGYSELKDCIITDEEENFPIAYSLVVHNDAMQVEKLLRSIYRPHNHYCIHVDNKSNDAVFQNLQTISKCFDNIFLTEKREAVTYAHYSRLKADLNCMSDLLARNSSWKYLINLTGQMFPLKTNREIVKILSSLRGTNDVEGYSWFKSKEFDYRYEKVYKVINGKLRQTSVPKSSPPLDITLLKGSAFGSFSREFVEYVLTDKKVKVLLDWLQDTYSPDEFFWPTVNSRYVNPMFNAPGAYDGAPERLPWLSTFAAWVPRDKCQGKIVRGICIFGVGDLQQLISRPEMFANKFYSNYQPLALDCMEEWIHNKTFNPQPFPVFSYLEKHYYLHPHLE